MQYTVVKTPVWANAGQTAINCVVTFADIGEVPFTASPNDQKYPHVGEIFTRCVNGDFGAIAAYTAPVVTQEEQRALARQAAYNADAAAARADNKLRALADMTPTQARVWVLSNVNNLADAKDIIATLAVAVSILAKRL